MPGVERPSPPGPHAAEQAAEQAIRVGDSRSGTSRPFQDVDLLS
jgi:hypothetical protein